MVQRKVPTFTDSQPQSIWARLCEKLRPTRQQCSIPFLCCSDSTRCSEKDFFLFLVAQKSNPSAQVRKMVEWVKAKKGKVLFFLVSHREKKIENPAVLLSLVVEKDLLPIRKVVGGNPHQLYYCRCETRHRTKVESTRKMEILNVQVISFYQGQL